VLGSACTPGRRQAAPRRRAQTGRVAGDGLPARLELLGDRVVIDQQYPYGFRWWHIALPIKPSYISQSNDGKRLYRTLNHLRDGIWSHHGQQTALLEIELSLLEFAVSITRSVHAIEVSVVRDRISRSVS
jgi:hypothetical protein